MAVTTDPMREAARLLADLHRLTADMRIEHPLTKAARVRREQKDATE